MRFCEKNADPRLRGGFPRSCAARLPVRPMVCLVSYELPCSSPALTRRLRPIPFGTLLLLNSSLQPWRARCFFSPTAGVAREARLDPPGFPQAVLTLTRKSCQQCTAAPSRRHSLPSPGENSHPHPMLRITPLRVCHPTALSAITLS